MGRMKFLGFSFLAAVLLVGINSCGVPSPVTPEVVTVEPVTGSTITSTDAIIVTFSTSMVPGTLTLTGDMVGVSDRGVWFQNNSTNDTLVIRPNAANGGIWSAGQHNLTIDVEATSGVAIQSLTLDYEIVATVPTVAVLSPENSSTIIGSTPIVIVFSVAMDPLTLVLSGDMEGVSDGGVWSTTLNENDTLVISSSSAWNNATENIIIDVDSAEGASLATLSLFYTVDVEVPTVESVLPADTSAIQGSTPIVISFSLGMRTSTLNLSGSMADENPDIFWTSTTKAFDTLTITPSSGWSDGPHTVSIDAVAFNGFVLPTENLSYEVDATLAVPAETPARNSLITSGEIIVIDFGEEMDIGTLAASGSLWDDGDGGAWSMTNNILTISPATLWPAGPIALTLDIVDLVGNSIATLILNYTVDATAPTVLSVMPVSASDLYNVNALAVADEIVINYSEKMDQTSLSLLGDMKDESDSIFWSKTTDDDDTLTIGTSTAWTVGTAQTLNVTVNDVAGNAVTEELSYNVFADLCSDGIKNQDETDIDCGGPDCTACSGGDVCGLDGDCSSDSCGFETTDICDFDTDGDAVLDVNDNCPSIINPDQLNTDGDGEGDACDADDDNDGVLDGSDVDSLDPAICADADIDTCDDCSIGVDGFGVLADNTPANDGLDTDSDGLCDAGDTDIDGDGEANGTDCAPTDSSTFPAASENCYDAVDNDCDGDVDFDDAECTAICGDNVTTAPEECDDAGESASCDADCTNVFCGDGVHNAAALEECDDGDESATCTNLCTVSACGDGFVNATAGEACDDGNNTDGDGCDSACIIEPVAVCGDGIVTAPEECDGGVELATCDADCTNVFCGDGVLNITALEQCDDGNNVDGDGCDAACTIEPVAICGDGVLTAPEECDGGGELASCDVDCTNVFCGDGVLNTTALEQCDDGNNVSGDGCDAACTIE